MNVSELITEKIIEALQNGVIPWQRPWNGWHGPRNVKTGKEYRGINYLLLSLAGGDDYFLTFKQAQELGGSVKKGSKSKMVCFCSPIEDKDNPEKKRFILRYYNVFALNECENVAFVRPTVDTIAFTPIDLCEQLLPRVSAPITFGGSQAFYMPSAHSITLPPRETFKSIGAFYATMFHEIGHSLMEHSDDKAGSSFGSEPYEKEELVAEIFSSMVLNYCGIDTTDLFDNSVAYIQSWIKKLQNDSKFIISAASKAQRRFDYLIGATTEENEE
jgi:antirestriction protein ArdC